LWPVSAFLRLGYIPIPLSASCLLPNCPYCTFFPSIPARLVHPMVVVPCQWRLFELFFQIICCFVRLKIVILKAFLYDPSVFTGVVSLCNPTTDIAQHASPQSALLSYPPFLMPHQKHIRIYPTSSLIESSAMPCRSSCRDSNGSRPVWPPHTAGRLSPLSKVHLLAQQRLSTASASVD
jgi:hypothetical protein